MGAEARVSDRSVAFERIHVVVADRVDDSRTCLVVFLKLWLTTGKDCRVRISCLQDKMLPRR